MLHYDTEGMPVTAERRDLRLLDILKEQVVAVAKEAERWACAGTNQAISVIFDPETGMW